MSLNINTTIMEFVFLPHWEKILSSCKEECTDMIFTTVGWASSELDFLQD